MSFDTFSIFGNDPDIPDTDEEKIHVWVAGIVAAALLFLVAVKAGMKPEGPVDARYAFDPKGKDGVWTFTSLGIKYTVDGNSCAIKSNQ